MLQQQINGWLILVFPLPIVTGTNDLLILKYLFNKSKLVVINKIKYPCQHLGKTQLKHKGHSCTKTFCTKVVGSGSSTTSYFYTPNSWVNSSRNPRVGWMHGLVLGMISRGCTRSLLWVMSQFFMNPNSVDASFHLANSSDENFMELVSVWFFKFIF